MGYIRDIHINIIEKTKQTMLQNQRL